jgi:hypothetical protein
MCLHHFSSLALRSQFHSWIFGRGRQFGKASSIPCSCDFANSLLDHVFPGSAIQHDPINAEECSPQGTGEGDGRPLERTPSSPHSPSRSAALKSSLSPAFLLGMTMVARAEIGLLILEIGYNNTSYIYLYGFITAIWAILLNTIIGPVCARLLIKYKGNAIGNGPWGLVPGPHHAIEREM